MKRFICPKCEKEFYSNKERVYCSRECAGTFKHGESDSRLFVCWNSMINRCLSNEDYIAKGIKVCEEWKDYLVFRAWALSHGYADDLELDRIKNHLGYFAENCRWVTESQQSGNTTKRRGQYTSKYKGVSWNPKHNKWIAQSGIKGKKKGLGYFVSELAAAIAYDDYVFAMDSEHAHLNFPGRLRKETAA